VLAGSELELVNLSGSVRLAISRLSLAGGWPVLSLSLRICPVRFGGQSAGQACRFEFIAARLELELVLARRLGVNWLVVRPAGSELEPLNLPASVRRLGVNCLFVSPAVSAPESVNLLAGFWFGTTLSPATSARQFLNSSSCSWSASAKSKTFH
jgi:hypothetical protein